MRLDWQSKDDHRQWENEPKCKPITLIVDGDLGFTFWLGQSLDSIGWTSLPAQNITAALELVRLHPLQLDVLVIDPFVRDAFAFVAGLRKTQPFLKVVAAIPEAWERSWPPLPEFDAAIRKPAHFTALARMDWVDLLQSILSDAHGKTDDTAGN